MDQLINTHMADDLYKEIKLILSKAKTTALVAINSEMVMAYWRIGKLIVETQKGEHRASYGANLINELSQRLTIEFGKGFDSSNLRNMRQFFLTFPNCDSLRHNLSWTHYRQLIRVSNAAAREYYTDEAAKGQWSVRQLERQIHSQSYERLLSTHRDKSNITRLNKTNLPTDQASYDPLTLIHDPFVLEFLDIKPDVALQETALEEAIITHLEQFLLELGRGFAFLGRQKRIILDGQSFYPDLVFYNIPARCYVIIDLKMGRADYSDIGQMQLYVNYYNMEICNKTDNPTIGIVLCAEKNDAVVRYTLGDRKDIGVFSAKYKLFMPTEEELKREIEISRENFRLIND